LVINQLIEEYGAKKEDLVLYHRHAFQILDRLNTVELQHIPRSANKMANTLTNLVATLALGAEEDMNMQVCVKLVVMPL